MGQSGIWRDISRVCGNIFMSRKQDKEEMGGGERGKKETWSVRRSTNNTFVVISFLRVNFHIALQQHTGGL